MALRLGLGLGAGGGRTLLDSDALSYFNRAGIASGDITIPKYSNKNIMPNSITPYASSSLAWQIVGGGVTAVSTTAINAPDGSSTVGILTATTTNGGWVRDSSTITPYLNQQPAGVYTGSVYAKAGASSILKLLIFMNSGDKSVSFNLASGTIVSSSAATGTITDVGGGWYRCSVTPTTSGTIQSFHIVRLVTPAVGDSIYYWGPQLEIGSSATAYVPTTTPAKGIDGTITVNPRRQLIHFIKGVKALGLWNNFICWPLRSFQNSNTLLTARSLGGLGIYDATIANTSAGTAWRNDGLYMNASSAQTLTVGTLPFYLFNLGVVINRDALNTGASIRFSQGGGRVPWLSTDNFANISTTQFGGSVSLVATGATTAFNEFAYVSGGQTSATTLSLFANGTFANSSSLPVIATSGTQSNQLISAGGAGISGSHTYSIIVGTNLQSDAIATSDFFELYKSTLGQGLSMR